VNYLLYGILPDDIFSLKKLWQKDESMQERMFTHIIAWQASDFSQKE